jgi:hypothetical protein
VPLEEIAALFGDTEEIMVFSEDIHIDHTTHELIVDEHGHTGVRRIATEAGKPGAGLEAGHVEKVPGDGMMGHAVSFNPSLLPCYPPKSPTSPPLSLREELQTSPLRPFPSHSSHFPLPSPRTQPVFNPSPFFYYSSLPPGSQAHLHPSPISGRLTLSYLGTQIEPRLRRRGKTRDEPGRKSVNVYPCGLLGDRGKIGGDEK